MLVLSVGVGRRSATCLVASMHGMKVCAPNVTKGSSVRNFYTDLKAVMSIAGVAGEEVVLFIEEHHVVDGMLVDRELDVHRCKCSS